MYMYNVYTSPTAGDEELLLTVRRVGGGGPVCALSEIGGEGHSLDVAREDRGGPCAARHVHTILYYTILYYTILYYTTLHYTTLHHTTLYYIILYYTIL